MAAGRLKTGGLAPAAQAFAKQLLSDAEAAPLVQGIRRAEEALGPGAETRNMKLDLLPMLAKHSRAWRGIVYGLATADEKERIDAATQEIRAREGRTEKRGFAAAAATVAIAAGIYLVYGSLFASGMFTVAASVAAMSMVLLAARRTRGLCDERDEIFDRALASAVKETGAAGAHA